MAEENDSKEPLKIREGIITFNVLTGKTGCGQVRICVSDSEKNRLTWLRVPREELLRKVTSICVLGRETKCEIHATNVVQFDSKKSEDESNKTEISKLDDDSVY